MNKTILLLILCAVCSLSYGQDEFDYSRDFETILNGTKDSLNALYYPRIFQRFTENDTTLTDREVLSLMIGFTDNENYKPYSSIEKEREILQLIRDKEYDKTIEKCDILLETNPFNLAALMEKGFALWKLENEDSNFYKLQYFQVLDAILYSGNGSKNNAFFVLSPIDGQIVIRYVWQASIGNMGSGSDKNGNFVDILELQKEGKESETIHFNIQHAKGKMD